MTLVSQIIIDAFRQSNLLALTASPTTAQSTEALRYLNRIVKATLGFEAGEELTSFPIGNLGYTLPAGFPGYNPTPGNDWYVPENTRLIINTIEPMFLTMPPAPNDGARVAVVAGLTDLSTNYIILVGNGNTFNGASLATVASDSEFFYRADLAEWVPVQPLAADGIFPFPEEFDDYFISTLALRLNPSYGATMDQQSVMVMSRAKAQLQARYAQIVQTGSELGLIRPSRMTQDRNQWGYYQSYWNPNSLFNRGYPW